ncbi:MULTISPECIES: SDR family NAD(P)-dependent oxidoreductase [Cysteiniphilum]|uniref:NAD(P)-dependent oxidoreductase n=1 Tax=Cysteiniphilum litorale TaxID=2056700 RepID=A0A8J3E9J2_9GAMM|nr:MULTISPECIES: SDR family NAD(P)-dependent oxidoreductase [Cysteiniphilum]GGF99966.1 NAD(P)-dependent oxidoreductase [Cysteiniphilum litorale]
MHDKPTKSSITNIKPVVFITGASSGFGAEMARKYNANGHPVILTARRFGHLQALAKTLNQDFPIHIAELNVTDKDAIDQVISALPEHMKNISILINNAGLALGLASFQDADELDFETMINTNINGLLYVTKRILPLMLDNNHGHIINIGSIAANWPYPGGHVYCASKAFVQQFSRALRSDLQGKNIRVTDIEPGLAQTEFSVVRFKGDAQKANQVYDQTEPLLAHDIAEIVYFTTSLPQHININTLEVMPTCQSWAPLNITRS